MGPTGVNPAQPSGTDPSGSRPAAAAPMKYQDTEELDGDEAHAAFVESLRRAIDDGTYRVNSRAVAERLLDRLFPPKREVH